MKLQFIQNLSDQIIRENYQLKSQVQAAKLTLKDYESLIVEAFTAVAPHKQKSLHPKELLQQFIKITKQESIQYKSLKHHTQGLRNQFEQLQKQLIKTLRTISQKSIEGQSLKQQINEEGRRSRQRQQQLQTELQRLQQVNYQSINQIHQLKMQRLKIVQGKRKEMEQLKLVQSNQMIAFREKNENEHMLKEKQLKKQLEMRNNTIKSMSKSITELTNSTSLENSQKILADIFRSFQTFEELAKLNKQLKDENQQLRQQVKELYNRLIGAEAHLQEYKESGSMTQSKLEEVMMEKQQIENKLVLKINEMQKSKKDKQALEQYYDNKWNSQYKKVKIKLQQSYKLKIVQLEEQSKLRMVSIETSLRQLTEEKKYFQDRNSQLQLRYSEDQKEKESILGKIREGSDRIKQLIMIGKENNAMFKEQIHMMKVRWEEQKLKLLQEIRKKQQTIKAQGQNLVNTRIKHFQQIAQMQQIYQQQISNQATQFERQKSVMELQFNQRLQLKQRQVQTQANITEVVKKQAKGQLQQQIKLQKEKQKKALYEKEEQMQRLNHRWKDKHQQLQNLLLVTRKKFQQERDLTRKRIDQLLASQFCLNRQKDLLKQRLSKLQESNLFLQSQIQIRNQGIAERQGKIKEISQELGHCKQQVQVLVMNRRSWTEQLLQVQRQLYHQLQQAKKINQKQVSLLKDKINELEEMNRQKANNKKIIQKLKNIQMERHAFKSEIHIKQAENIILHQVKDYYQTKLREAEQRIGRGEFVNQFKGNPILHRKLKKNRITINQAISQRVFEPPSTKEETKQSYIPSQRTRYNNSSVKKEHNLSLSKSKFQQNTKKIRVHTLTSFK